MFFQASKIMSWLTLQLAWEATSLQFPTNSSQPTPDSGACDGNLDLQFQLELRTDTYGDETSWVIHDMSSQDDDDNAEPLYWGSDYEGNTLYTLPSKDDFYCLELESCYLFAIFDDVGDGMETDENAGYKGFLGGVEIFWGDNTFDNDGYNETHRFCVGDNTTFSPTDFPTLSPTDFPTPSPTAVTTTSPTDFPTPSPTDVTTSPPTDFPTPSPTPAPTPSPTGRTTAGFTTSSSIGLSFFSF